MFSNYSNAYSILQLPSPPELIFGQRKLDRAFKGFPPGIVELSGTAGTGKTQIGLHLTVQCILPKSMGGVGKGCCYIFTKQVPWKRMCEISEERNFDLRSSTSLFVTEIREQRQLMHLITQDLEALFKKMDIRLVVIDNIGDLARNREDYIKRAKDFYIIAKTCRKLAYKHKATFIFMNQATDVFPTDPLIASTFKGSILSEGRRVKPSLGLAWSNCVNTRILLKKDQRMTEVQRELKIDFSPMLKSVRIPFQIGKAGILDA